MIESATEIDPKVRFQVWMMIFLSIALVAFSIAWQAIHGRGDLMFIFGGTLFYSLCGIVFFGLLKKKNYGRRIVGVIFAIGSLAMLVSLFSPEKPFPTLISVALMIAWSFIAWTCIFSPSLREHLRHQNPKANK